MKGKGINVVVQARVVYLDQATSANSLTRLIRADVERFIMIELILPIKGYIECFSDKLNENYVH